MADIKTRGGTRISSSKDGGFGSTVKPIYTERHMKCYAVSDSDLSHLSFANWLVTGLWAAASFLLAHALQIHLSAAFTADLPPEAKLLSLYVKPLLFVFAGLFFVAGVCAHWWRMNNLDIIKRESIDLQKGK